MLNYFCIPGSLKQGKRRLKRAYTTHDIESTDENDVALSSMPVIFNSNEIEKELDDMGLMVLPEMEEADKRNNEETSTPQYRK